MNSKYPNNNSNSGRQLRRDPPEILTNEGLSKPQSHSIGVLVIEDDRLMRTSIERGLREQGLRVWVAAEGWDGIAVYNRFHAEIDIILCDVRMPGLDGPGTLDALRAIKPDIRLCFMTGDAQSSTSAKLRERGAMCVFIKPLPPIVNLAEELKHLATMVLDQAVAAPLPDADAPPRVSDRIFPEGTWQRLMAAMERMVNTSRSAFTRSRYSSRD